MASFLEKLKKGMGVEEVKIEKEKETVKKPPRSKLKIKPKAEEVKKEEVSEEISPPEVKKIAVQEKKEKEEKKTLRARETWLEPEGQLVIDVYQTDQDLFIQSPIAGVRVEDLDIEIERETVTVQGERQKPSPEKADYFTKECYWGKFSRQIILPVEIDPNRIEAFFKEGILTIKMPKLLKEKKRKIVPKEES
jgi:HSP20 family protein